MAAGFSFISSAVGPAYESVLSGAVVAGVLAAGGYVCAKALKKEKEVLIPDEHLSARTFGELVAGMMVKMGDMAMGTHNRRYLPFIGTLFVYLFCLNLSGLVPGFHGPTGGKLPDSMVFNVGIAVVVFIGYHVWGVREVGPINYLKHFFGGPALVRFPMILVGLLLFSIELISHFVRIFSLSLRLFGNMTGDHLLLQVFTDMTKLIIPVVFYGLGTFVSLVQAFVFTLLSMVYIRVATAHEEEH